MSGRKQLSRKVRQEEREWVTQYCFERVAYDPYIKGTPTEEFYKDYRKWVKDKGHAGTRISVDGFGRLLPKSLTRRYLYDGVKLRKAVVHARIA